MPSRVHTFYSSILIVLQTNLRWTEREIEDKERAIREMQDYKDQKQATEQIPLDTAFDMTRLCVQSNAQLLKSSKYVASAGFRVAEQDIKEGGGHKVKSVCNGACGIEGCCGTVKRHGCKERWCSDRWHQFSCEQMQYEMDKGPAGMLHIRTQCPYHRELQRARDAIRTPIRDAIKAERKRAVLLKILTATRV
jgi:hypothetical protein